MPGSGIGGGLGGEEEFARSRKLGRESRVMEQFGQKHRGATEWRSAGAGGSILGGIELGLRDGPGYPLKLFFSRLCRIGN